MCGLVLFDVYYMAMLGISISVKTCSVLVELTAVVISIFCWLWWQLRKWMHIVHLLLQMY